MFDFMAAGWCDVRTKERRLLCGLETCSVRANKKKFGEKQGLYVNASMYNSRMVKSRKKLRVRRHFRDVIRLVNSVVNDGEHDEVELIHQLRTEARRADAVLNLFVNVLPHGRTKRVRRRLAIIRKKAGRVRDLDVFAVVFSQIRNQLPNQLWNLVDERVKSDRVIAMYSLRRYCRKLLKVRFDKRVRAVISLMLWRRVLSNGNANVPGVEAINRLAAKFFRSIDFVKRDERLFHEVRIQGRRLRYTLDLLSDVLPKNEAVSICASLSLIQEKLGTAHDQISALNFLRSCSPESLPMRLSLFKFAELWQEEIDVLIKIIVQESIDEAERLHLRIAELACWNLAGHKKIVQ